ncbi:MAG: hypothetical protein RL654_1337 [Pseudomonadota bacterium]
MAFVQAVLHGYRKHGIDPSAALRHAQIEPAQLSQPQACISARQFELLGEHAMPELDDEALGWFSRRMRWGTYGMLVRACVSAPTLGIALRRWCRLHGLLVDDISLQLSVESDGQATLTVHEHVDLGEVREFCLLSMLRSVHGLSCWMTDDRVTLTEVALPVATPAHRRVYMVLFPVPVRFGSSAARMRFPAEVLDRPVLRDEAATRELLQYALPLIVRQYDHERRLGKRLRDRLRRHDGQLPCTEALAEELNMSVRTLHRQLAHEGESLQALKDEVRYSRAEMLLARSGRPIKQIAATLGFGSERSFARAFQRWSGLSPAAFRQSVRTSTTEPAQRR